MKIWAQSAGAVAKGTFSTYGDTLVDYLKTAGRPGTIVDLYGVGENAPGIDNYQFAEHLTTREVVGNAIRAEQQGYDAFVVVNTWDMGYHEVRETTGIPAVFITESALLLARQLGHRYAFFTHAETMLRKGEALARKYGLDDRMVPGGTLGISYKEFPDLFANPNNYMDRLMDTARRLVARGADILIPAGNPYNLFLIREGIREIEGAPVMDVCAVAIKQAEMLVDLKEIGVTRSRRGAFTPGTPDQLAIVRQRYS